MNTHMHAQRGLGLAALVATLGELVPQRDADVMTMDHVERLDVLAAAAPFAPVTCPQDAALALSAAAFLINEVQDFEFSEADRAQRLTGAHRALGQIACWMAGSLRAPPLADMWPSPPRHGQEGLQ